MTEEESQQIRAVLGEVAYANGFRAATKAIDEAMSKIEGFVHRVQLRERFETCQSILKQYRQHLGKAEDFIEEAHRQIITDRYAYIEALCRLYIEETGALPSQSQVVMRTLPGGAGYSWSIEPREEVTIRSSRSVPAPKSPRSHSYDRMDHSGC